MGYDPRGHHRLPAPPPRCTCCPAPECGRMSNRLSSASPDYAQEVFYDTAGGFGRHTMLNHHEAYRCENGHFWLELR